jgi:uncharacterized integral membrane protein
MKQAYFAVGLILGLLIAIFASQNTGEVEIRFLPWQLRGSLALVVLAAGAVGALLALLFAIPEVLTARWHIHRLRRRIDTVSPDRPASPASGLGIQSPDRTL